MFSFNLFSNSKKQESVNEQAAPESQTNPTTESPSESAKTASVTHVVRNLIILDESGSVMSIYKPALDGVNETLQTIRGAQNEHPGQKHYVTLVTFDTGHYNEIYRNVPAAKAQDINEMQYCPNGGTPLFDAMGRAINELRSEVGEDDVVLVTVITDGYENASREYTGKAIKALVEEMRAKGWVFTYIGANQDVEKVAASMAINNHMAFDANIDGTKAMFAKEMKSRRAFFSKVGIVPKENLENDYFDGF